MCARAANAPVAVSARDEDAANAASNEQHVHGDDAEPFGGNVGGMFRGRRYLSNELSLDLWRGQEGAERVPSWKPGPGPRFQDAHQ